MITFWEDPEKEGLDSEVSACVEGLRPSSLLDSGDWVLSKEVEIEGGRGATGGGKFCKVGSFEVSVTTGTGVEEPRVRFLRELKSGFFSILFESIGGVIRDGGGAKGVLEIGLTGSTGSSFLGSTGGGT